MICASCISAEHRVRSARASSALVVRVWDDEDGRPRARLLAVRDTGEPTTVAAAHGVDAICREFRAWLESR